MSKISAVQKGISYLLWNAPKGKVNPKTLGYVLPNGNINFQTKESAYNYAKNCVMKALKSENPYERGLVIKGNTIVADVHGSQNEIRFADELDLWGTTIVHGHPDNTPISLGDAPLIVSNRAKKMVAINKNGEYSSLKLLPFKISKLFSFLPTRLKSYIEHAYMYGNLAQIERAGKGIISKVNNEVGFNSLINEIKTVYKNADKPLKKIIREWDKDLSRNRIGDTSKIPMNIRHLFDRANELQLKAIPKQSKYVHELWQKHAKDFDMVYETNYSDDIIKSWDV